MANVLSIQSHVVSGHVGNDAAAFALQRLGIEAWPIHTVQFSNHTGHGSWTGEAFSAAHIRDLLDGLDRRGLLARADAVLSGYVGGAETGGAIADAVQRVKAQNPKAIYCCDPVMGDVGRGVFVKPEIPPFFRETALPLVDILTPNVFELGLLTDSEPQTRAEMIAAARSLIARGPRIVLVTSARAAEDGDALMSTLAVTADQAWRVTTPFIALDPMPNGMGDCIAALFLGHYLSNGNDIAHAASRAVSALYEVVLGTDPTMPRELNVIAKQNALVVPNTLFNAELLHA